jgi:hypothetical protein
MPGEIESVSPSDVPSSGSKIASTHLTELGPFADCCDTDGRVAGACANINALSDKIDTVLHTIVFIGRPPGRQVSHKSIFFKSVNLAKVPAYSVAHIGLPLAGVGLLTLPKRIFEQARITNSVQAKESCVAD